MLITCITHADARDGKVYPFRGLTDLGFEEIRGAAERFKRLIGEDALPIKRIVSSPKARCVESAVLFAKAVSELTDTSELELDAGLKAGSINGHEVFELANRTRVQHLFVSGHADLARVLPGQVNLMPGAANKGWFGTRPVLILMEYEIGEAWEKAQVLSCEGLVDGEWINLIQVLGRGEANG